MFNQVAVSVEAYLVALAIFDSVHPVAVACVDGHHQRPRSDTLIVTGRRHKTQLPPGFVQAGSDDHLDNLVGAPFRRDTGECALGMPGPLASQTSVAVVGRSPNG
jgi:hypothetical protein